MEDRRIQRTRQLLEQALIELIEEHDFESITIQEITDRARLGRATFYLHYRDKEHLLQTTLQRLQEDLSQQLEPLRPQDLFVKKIELSEQVFQHVARYSHLYQVLLSERGAALARNRLMANLTRQAEYFVVDPLLVIVGEPTVPVSFLATYVSGTLYSAIIWWLDHQQQKTPEEMGHLVRALIQPALTSILNIDPQRLILPEE